MSAPVIIEDYDPLWPQRFETLRSRIAAALGPVAVVIEHVGSTAVPGMAAKPIIDLDVLMRSPADLPAAIRTLASVGYEHLGDLGVPGREAFRAPVGDFPHHLYVCPPGSEELRRHLAFRDYLRAHPVDARAYGDLKRSLADKFTCDRDAYTLAKYEFVEMILRKAQLHSSTTG